MTIYPFSASNLGLVLIGAGLLAYFIYCWRYLRQKTTPEQRSLFAKPVLRFAVVLGVYQLALCLLAAAGFFNVITVPPRFLLIFLPMLLVVLLLAKTKRSGILSFLDFLPPVFLVGIQAMRVLVELLFLQFAAEKIIPVTLSLHGRNVDVLIGVLAIPVSLLLAKKHRLADRAALVFNLLGILSLVNIFSIAVPALPSTFRVYDTLYLPTYFPGVLIVFVASSALFLHVLSLRQLLEKKQPHPKMKAKEAERPALVV